MMGTKSYLIIGAGVFGGSTALHLVKKYPGAEITLVDRHSYPNRSAASSDLNKIIRADYDDRFYMKLALESQEAWRTNPIFSPFYHESGMLFAEDMDMGRKCLTNYEMIGEQHAAEMLTPEDARARFPIFKDANWEDVTENFFNARSGWGEADGALCSLIQAGVDRGVHFIQGSVARLTLNERKECEGIELEDGRRIRADCTLLCTGAYTAKVLADTAPNWPGLQVDGRMVAAGAVQSQAKYAQEEEERLSQAPVHFIGMWHTHGESIPPCNGRLKFNCEVSFTNMVYHEGLQQEISIPPAPKGQSTFGDDVPEGLKEEVRNVIQHTYGRSIKGLEVTSYRMCWDAVSPNQDWIIDAHPRCKNLFIAGAGSFHSWKFMPTIGAYVTQKLDGTLDAEKSRRWAWDRESSGGACIMYIPTRDVKSIGPFKGWPKVSVKVA